MAKPAAFGWLCVETLGNGCVSGALEPAAFGRLCVETAYGATAPVRPIPQPPSGGCVLKHPPSKSGSASKFQPPSGGCVLKL